MAAFVCVVCSVWSVYSVYVARLVYLLCRVCFVYPRFSRTFGLRGICLRAAHRQVLTPSLGGLKLRFGRESFSQVQILEKPKRLRPALAKRGAAGRQAALRNAITL